MLTHDTAVRLHKDGKLPKEIFEELNLMYLDHSKLVPSDSPFLKKMEGLQVIMKEEESGQVCPKGAFVTAHYHGTLADGSVFDSSVQRNEPFLCQIGVGQVIKGWDEGFTQMKKGAKATLICPPAYAYGPRGSPPVIPPNATLTFEVELLDFKI